MIFNTYSQTRVKLADLLFNYGSGDSAQYVQDHEIIKPLANITVNNEVLNVSIEVKAVNVGSVIVGINSSSDEFAK